MFLVIVLVFMIFITVLVFLLWIISMLTASKQLVHARLENLDEAHQIYDHREDEMDEMLLKRLFRPWVDSFGKAMTRLAPGSNKNRTEMMLRRAGHMEKSAIGSWHIKNLIIGVVLPLLIGIIIYLMTKDIAKTFLYVSFLIVLFRYVLLFNLKRQISKRQKEIGKSLPDVLDLVTVSVEAGLSFDGAIDRVIRQMPNALSEELAVALKEMRMGKTRREGLRALSERCEVDDLTTLIGALIQADELGVSIGGVLRIQSQQMREKRRQRAREAAMKAPIKMLFPLMFFIFPTIFVVLIGPAIIRMMEVF